MISFKIISEENRENVIELLAAELDDTAKMNFLEIVDTFAVDNEEDVEFALCVFADCLLIRVFDMGRYFSSFLMK